jgi:hypothetical protein
MTDEEIIRALKAIRHSSISDRVAGRSRSISDVAKASGICNMHIYCIIKGSYRLGPKSRAALSCALEECKVERGERGDPRLDRSASFSGGSGAFLTVRFPR